MPHWEARRLPYAFAAASWVKHANHTEIPALFRADSVILGVLAQKPDKMRGTHGEWVNAKTLFHWQRSNEDIP